MKALLILAALLGVTLSHPGPLTPTLRFHAKRQTQNFTLAQYIQEFTLDLSAVLWETEGSNNVVLSPLSISSLMSLLLSGSGGSTYEQLRYALYYPAGVSDFAFHQKYQEVINALSQTSRDVVVNIATRLFPASGSHVLSSFTQLATEHYAASVRALDFRNNPIAAMNSINDWVKEETRGKIPRLITEPFNPSTNFVAANTLYFNGAWEHPFNPQLTQDYTFDTGLANITVPMMSATMTIPYVNMRQLNAEMIALPYKEYEYGMFLVRPNGPIEDKTLQTVESALSATRINNYIKEMVNSTRKVSLPRMRLVYKTYLKPTLKSLKVSAMFNPTNANFSRLTANEHVWVEDLIHQTVVEVTETGTVAAAATAVSLNRIGTSLMFNVDRPTIVFIRHMDTGVPLFWGRIMKPDPLYDDSKP